MYSITIEISSKKEFESLLKVIREMGLNWRKGNAEELAQEPTPAERYQKLVESAPKLTPEEEAYHLAVIEKGGDLDSKTLDEMLKWHEADRQDRSLPNP